MSLGALQSCALSMPRNERHMDYASRVAAMDAQHNGTRKQHKTAARALARDSRVESARMESSAATSTSLVSPAEVRQQADPRCRPAEVYGELQGKHPGSHAHRVAGKGML